MKRLVIGMAMVCIVLGMAAAAFAVPANEVLIQGTIQTFTGLCCFSWGETISIAEPAVVAPVVVTWSSDYRLTARRFFQVGFSVNGHPCLVKNDLAVSTPSDGTFDSRTSQWIIFPSDGLMKGTNNITLCGGGGDSTDTIALGLNTLAVRISK